MTVARIHELFGEIAALAATERRVHPGLNHAAEVDPLLEGLRQRTSGILGEAAAVRGMCGDDKEVMVEGVRFLMSERESWRERLAAAEAAAGLERQKRDVLAVERTASLRAGGAVGRTVVDFGLREACRLLCQRVGMFAPSIDGDAVDFAERHRDLENAAKSFTNALGIAHREHRLRVAAKRADDAVAAAAATRLAA